MVKYLISHQDSQRMDRDLPLDLISGHPFSRSITLKIDSVVIIMSIIADIQTPKTY